MTDNLTGVWDGTFVQPQVGMVTFLATLIEFRRRARRKRDRTLHHARLPIEHPQRFDCGSSIRHAVSFVKRYEPPGYGYNTVSYEGLVNAEATEIDGRWRLPGTTLSGTFLMVRSTKPAQSIANANEERTKEPAR